MHDTAGSWIKGLPWRWAIGGFVIGVLWVGLSIGLTVGTASPYGVITWTSVRIGLAFAIPMAALGGLWGLSERRKLRAPTNDGTLAHAADRFLPRQIGKSMICGPALWAFLHVSGLLGPGRDGLPPIVGFVLGAVPIGLGVGLVAGHALKRRVERESPASVF